MSKSEKNMAESAPVLESINAPKVVTDQKLGSRARLDIENVLRRAGINQRQPIPKEQVLENASLVDNKERLQKAKELLEAPLDQGQEEAILEAHKVGEGEAGVYNYTFKHIREKARILREAGFNEEQTRILLESGIAGSKAFEKLKAAAKNSKLKQATEVVNYATEAGEAFIASDIAIDSLVKDSKASVEAVLYPKTPQEQKELECVLYFVTDDISRIYTEAMSESPKAESEWSGTPKIKTTEDKIKDVHKSLDNYKETFWNYGEGVFRKLFEDADLPAPNVAALREKYGSIATFIASRAAIAIEKELRGVRSPIAKNLEEDLMRMTQENRRKAFREDPELRKKFLQIENIGDFFLIDIKADLLATRGERERDRRERRKRATANERLHYSDWRERFDFTWAETADELGDSIDDWLDYFQQALPKEIEESVYQEVQKGLTNVLSAYEKARNRIGLDAASVAAEALREKIVGRVTTIAGSRLVETKKGMEYFIKLKRDIAANYNGYNDAIYLSEGSAIMADKLSENDGEYYKGGPKHIKKPLDGDTEAYREKIKREAIKYGATHQLYITKEDFENAELGESEIRRQVIQEVTDYNNDPENTEKKTREDIEKMIKQRLDDRRDRNDRGYRYGWSDPIAELLLKDSRGKESARRSGDPERVRAAEQRTAVFNEIKNMLDKVDITDEEKAAGETRGLFGLSDDERKDRIRKRIERKIKNLGYVSRLDEIHKITPEEAAEKGLTVREAQDKALWAWVEEYNRPRLEMKREATDSAPWFPSLWDEERLSIDRPEMLVDRALTKEQFKAMVEKINDPYEGLTNKQIEAQIRDAFALQAQQEVQAQKFTPDEQKERESIARERLAKKLKREPRPDEIKAVLEREDFKRLMAERERKIKDRVDEVLFKRKQREILAIRNFNINVADDKFKGLEARWGGLTTRTVNEKTGEYELTTIYAEAEKILKAKIDKERRQVKDKVEEWEKGYVATHPGKTIDGYGEKEKEQIEKYKKEHPGLTLNAYDWEEIKWRQEYEDANKGLTPAQINKAVEAWRIGFKAAYGKTEEEMKELRVKQERLFRRNCTFAAVLGLEELGIAKDLPVVNYFYYGDVSQIGAFTPLVGYTDDDKGELPALLDRPRREAEAVWYFLAQQHMDGRILDVVDRDSGLIVEDKDGKRKPAHEERWVRPRVINAGGVLKLRDIFENQFMISTSGGVEVTDLIYRIGNLGVQDEALENGAKDKREWQGFRKRRCKWELRQQSFFNTREWADPLTHVDRLAGAAEARKFLTGGEIQGKGHIPGALIEPMSGAYKYRDMFYDRNIWMEGSDLKNLTLSDPELKGKVRQGLADVSNLETINPKDLDKLVEIGAGILKPLMDYMDARRYVMNRAGLAPKNWKYDNELIVNAYIDNLLNEEVMGEEDLDYAAPGRSPVAAAIFKNILKTSTYHILVEKDNKELYPKAKETKTKMVKQRRDSVAAILPSAVRDRLIGPNGEITKKMQELERQKKPLTLETEEGFSDLVEQALRKELHDQLQSHDPVNNPLEFGLPPNILNMLNKRWEVLVKQHVQGKMKKGYKGIPEGTDNIEAEIKRVLDQYLDTKLHMEFVGEWPARLLSN